MWEQQATPTEWKHALTILLYKKDDPFVVKNHRPIGLLNTVYKFWTAVVTKCLMSFVEEYSLLSEAQEGFRADRNTIRQLQRLVMAIEDAKLSGSPMYILYVDFVNAFGSVNHARMTSIMEMQGYPDDIVNIVKDLYRGASTSVRTPLGDTPSFLNLGKGNVQGDPLSPLLFIIAIDPLLRWLGEGGRGYRLTTSEVQLGPLGYADDLAVATPSLDCLRIQSQKIEAYCEWAGFQVNIDRDRKNKTAWTGPDKHGKAGDAVTLMGEVVPKLREREPYTYLGLPLSLSLTWATHKAVLQAKVREKLEAIGGMQQSPALVMRTLESVVRSTVRYAMPLGALGWEDITALNGAYWRGAKKIVGLSRHTSNRMVMGARKEFGLGVDALHLTQAAALVKAVQSLQGSQEDLGKMWRGLRDAHRERTGEGRVPHLNAYRTSFPVLNIMGQLQDLGVTYEGSLALQSGDSQGDDDPHLFVLMERCNAERTARGEKALSVAGVRPLLSAGLSTWSQVANATGDAVLSLRDLRMAHPELVLSTGVGRALHRVSVVLQGSAAPQVPRKTRAVSEMLGCSSVPHREWLGAGGGGQGEAMDAEGEPEPLKLHADSEGTKVTVELGKGDGKGGRKRSRAAAGGVEPLPGVANPGAQAYALSGMRSREYRSTPGGPAESNGWYVEVQYEGYKGWHWTHEDNLVGSEEQLEQDRETHRRSLPPILSSTRKLPYEGCRVAVLTYQAMDGVGDIACSVCRGVAATDDDDLAACDGCNQGFHAKCHTPPLEEFPEGSWLCAQCVRRGRGPQAELAALAEPGRPQGTLRTVSSRDTEYRGYPYVVMFDDPRLDPIYTDTYESHRAWGQPAGSQIGAPVQSQIEFLGGRPSLEQAVPAQDRGVQRSLRQRIDQGRLWVSAQETDPYRDLVRGGHRLREEGGLVHAYAPSGSWLGTMNADRFHFLRERWLQYWSGRARVADSEGDPVYMPLEWEVSHLFRRYKPGARKGDGGRVDITNHWSTRVSVRQCIFEQYGVTEESFASPLNCLMGGTQDYCSIHPRDVVFGARYDAYAWSGREKSAYANPEYSKADIEKALRWAIAASQESFPFCTVLILPRWLTAPYMNLFSHRNVTLVAKAARGSFSFLAPTHWEIGDPDPDCKCTTNWPVLVVEVSNEWGRLKYVQVGAREAVRESLLGIGARLVRTVDASFEDRLWTLKPPDSYVRAGRRGGRRRQGPVLRPQACPRLMSHVQAQLSTQGHLQVLDPRAELLSWRDGAGALAYTDGSVKGEAVGAGYVIPLSLQDGPQTEGMSEVQMKVQGPQTINRAELTAILAVLEDVPTDQPCTILSDSLVSIRNIARWVADPMQFRGNTHEDLLTAVCVRLSLRAAPTGIYKIRAHKGHPGNEMADQAAKAAADAEAGAVAARGLTPVEGSGPSRLCLGDTVIRQPTTQLRGPVHEWLAKRQGYLTTVSDIWAGAEAAGVDPVASTVLWRAGKTCSKKKLQQVLRLRFFDYVTQKSLYYRAPPAKRHDLSPYCPFGCRTDKGERREDSWIHTFLCEPSGAMLMSTARHNEACRIVGSAAAKGNLGRWLTLWNCGKVDGEAEEHTCPAYMLPNKPEGPLPNKPDFMFVKGWAKTDAPPEGPVPREWKEGDDSASVELVLCELKYTAEDNFAAKHAAAEEKYQDLRRLLQAAGWSVRPVVSIVVGHRGTTSSANRRAFHDIGITGRKEQDKLQEDLVWSSAKWAARLVALRRRKVESYQKGQRQLLELGIRI